MKIERFRHLAEAYGAEIARWPEAERDAAAALAATSAEAQHALAQARVLDAWLSVAEPALSDAQVERVFAAIQDRLDPPAGLPPFLAGRGQRSALWRAAGFLVFMGVCGYLTGNLGLTQATSESGFIVLASSSSTLAWNQ